MSEIDIAMLSGLAVTIIPAIIYFILLMTEDYSPIERRARRLAILAGVVSAGVIFGTTAIVHFRVSEMIGAFLMYPSVGLTGIAVWHASRITYRKMVGGRESTDRPSQEEGA